MTYYLYDTPDSPLRGGLQHWKGSCYESNHRFCQGQKAEGAGGNGYPPHHGPGQGRRALDLFAGTGQLGIEALSRGAASAVFVEQRREAAALIRDNLALTGLAGSARVVCGDAFAFLQSAKETFDIILIDPPFAAGLWENALNSISRFDILSDHGIIVCESPAQQEMPSLPPPYFLHRTYRYGQVKITTYHKEVEG